MSSKKRSKPQTAWSLDLSFLETPEFKAQIRANRKLTDCLRKKLAEAARLDVDVVGCVAVDLADIAQIGDNHRVRLKKLLNMKFPRDLEKLEGLLIEFEVDLLVHNQWHLNSLKRRLPKVLKSVRQQSRSGTKTKLR